MQQCPLRGGSALQCEQHESRVRLFLGWKPHSWGDQSDLSQEKKKCQLEELSINDAIELYIVLSISKL